MAKPLLRLKAIELRGRGESVNEIARFLGVSKGTVSLWVRDVILTVNQLEKLRNRSIVGSERGRLKGAITQKNRRLSKIRKYKRKGVKHFKDLTQEGFFAAGLALYWAEGSKKTPGVVVCNSDYRIINFLIRWLEMFFGVNKKDFAVNVGINEIHQDREDTVKKYWSEKTGIPLSQFRKTSYKKVRNIKVYSNHNYHFGTFNLKVLKSTDLYYKILGLIEGLAQAG